MSQIKLKHSGGNGVIIAAPSSNPAADRTLLLPSNADSTIDTLNRTGNVLQIVTSVITSDLIYNTSNDSSLLNSYNDTNMTASITPQFANSTILVNFSFPILLRDGNGGGAIGYGVKRNGTRVITTESTPHEQFTGDHLTGFRTLYTYVDTTHNSTSQQTYLLECFIRNYSGQVVEFNTRGATSNVVIYEVAA